MQRSSRDPSVDFYEHSTARGSTPGVDYFHSVSARRNDRSRRQGGFGVVPSEDSSSASGGVMSRSASQLTAMRAGDMSGGQYHQQQQQQQQHMQAADGGKDASQAVDESLADEVPARHLSIIEVARQMLLPVFYERLLDRQGLIQACGAVLDAFLDAESQQLRQQGAPEGAVVDPNQPLTEGDIAGVQRLVDLQLREIHKKRPNLATSNSSVAAGSGGDGGDSRSMMMMRRGVDNNVNDAMHDDFDDGRDSFAAGASSAGHGGRVSAGKKDAFGGDDQTALSESAVGTAFPSIFRSVTYSARGPLPPPPPHMRHGAAGGAAAAAAAAPSAAADAFLNVQLDPPHLTTSNSDVVLTGVVHTRALVDLRWWIAYGPLQLVVDLEKLRSIGAVGTFQVSHSAFILSIGAGTLIPGAEYTVHLEASAVEFQGIGRSARVHFVVPVAEDETQDILWRRLQRMTGGGYSGDTEKGVLSLRPDPAKMRELDNEYKAAKEEAARLKEQNERQQREKAVEKTRRAQILSASRTGKIDAATASRLLMAGQSLPAPILAAVLAEEEEAKRKAAEAAAARERGEGGGDERSISNSSVPNMAGTNLPDAAVVMAGGGSGGRNTLTFHEQLKNFIVNEVEPVYTLCASPRFTHEIFTQLLRTVTKQFWYARPAGSGVLDAALKKQILAELRKEISGYVQATGQKVQLATAPGGGPAGSPEAAKLLQASLERVAPDADINSVSLLSAEQRSKLLAGAGAKRRNSVTVGVQ